MHVAGRPISIGWRYTLLILSAQLAGCAGNGHEFVATSAQYTDGGAASSTAQMASADDANDMASIVADPNAPLPSSDEQGTAGATAQGALVMPLQGCFSSDYTVKVRLGDSATYNMIVDTGSGTLAVAASDCANCFGISPKYAPGPSAMDSDTLTGGAYGDGSSWSGDVFSDTVSMGQSNDVIMAFATIDKQLMSRTSGRNFFNASFCSGTATSNASQGILGFGGGGLALAHTDAFLDVLHSQSAAADMFATQFCDIGGTLWLGGYDTSTTSAEPRYTPMSTSTGFYEVTVQDMLLDGVPVGGSNNYGTAIVDTGTSGMIVTSTLFDAINNILDNDKLFLYYFGPGFLANGNCSVPARLTTRANLDARLPQLTLAFPDAQGNVFKVTMSATESYLMAAIQPNGALGYCPAIASGGGTDGLPTLLLGNSLMHSQITIFDRAGARLGLAPQVGCGHLEIGH